MNEKIVTIFSDKAPLLRMASQPCDFPVNETDRLAIEELKQALEEMKDSAIGIAAIQIGYPKRIFVLRINDQTEVFINPVVIQRSREISRKPESCLSIPNFVVFTERPKSLTLQYFDQQSVPRQKVFEGFLSRAVCHEMDHLEGILLEDHFNKQTDKRAKLDAERKRIKEKEKQKRRDKKRNR